MLFPSRCSTFKILKFVQLVLLLQKRFKAFDTKRIFGLVWRVWRGIRYMISYRSEFCDVFIVHNLSNISQKRSLNVFTREILWKLIKRRERKLCHKSNTSNFLELSVRGEMFGRVAGRPQPAGQFIKGDCTLVQSVNSNAINIYFNKIPSFYSRVCCFTTLFGPWCQPGPEQRKRIVFFSVGICCAVNEYPWPCRNRL